MEFPLPLVPFEEYMLLDDRPSHPMSFFVRLRFRGRLRRSALETAFTQAVGRHPLLTAVVRTTGRRWEWVQAKTPPPLEWRDEEPTERFPLARPIDLCERPGVECRVRQGAESADVSLQFHHSCCDGAGAMALTEDFLIHYANAISRSGERIEPKPIDSGSLRWRGSLTGRFWKTLKLVPRQLVGLQGVVQYAFRAPQPVTPVPPNVAGATLPADFPAVLTHAFDEQETAAIGTAARQRRVSVNDLLIRDVFVTLQRWRSKHEIGNSRDWLRFSMPMNVRTPQDVHMPAANRVSMIFLDRREIDYGDPDDLLQSIHDEVKLIQRCRLELTFLIVLKVMRRLPGGIGRVVGDDTCAASCIVSNVGKAFAHSPLPRRDRKVAIDNVVLEAIELGAPNRPFQGLAFVLLTYAGKLSVSLQYDARVVDENQAGDILASLRLQVCASAGLQGSEDSISKSEVDPTSPSAKRK